MLIGILAISSVDASEIATNSSDEISFNNDSVLESVSEECLSDVYNNSDEFGELDDYYPGFEYSMMYDDAYVNLTLPKDAKGNMLVSLYDYDDEDNMITTEIGNVQLIDGKASVKLPCLKLEGYWVEAEYTGSDYAVDSLNEYIEIIPKFNVPSIVWIEDEIYLNFEMPEGEMLELIIRKNNNMLIDTTVTNGSKVKLNNLTDGYYYFGFEDEANSYYADYDFYLEVRPDNPEFQLNITVPDVVYGEDTDNYIRFELPQNHYYFEDMLTVIIDGDKSKAIKFDSQDGYFDVENLSYGIHTVEVVCEADVYYKKASANTTFLVNYIAFNLDKFCEYGMISVDFDYIQNLTGYFVVYIDDKLNSVTFLDEKNVYLYLENVSLGKHNYEIRYSGNENYAPYSKTGTFDVDYSLKLYSSNYITYGENQLEIHINEHATGNVIVVIDGKKYAAKINEGRAILELPNLVAGTYPITIIYEGNEFLNAKTIRETLEINYEIKVENDYINLTLPENANGNLIAHIFDNYVDLSNYDNYLIYGESFDGNILKEYEVPLVNGKASISLSDLDYGEYYVIAEYDGEDYIISQISSSIWIEDDIGSHVKVELLDEVPLNSENYINIKLDENYDKELLNVKILDDNDTLVFSANGETKIKIPTSKLGFYCVNIAYGERCLENNYFDVYPQKANFPDYYSTVKLGEVVSVEMPADAKGKMILDFYNYAFGGAHELQIISNQSNNGKISMTINNLTSKHYLMRLMYVDEVYGNYTRYIRMNVIGYDSDLNITSFNNQDSTVFNINLNNDANGQLVLSVNGEVYDSKVNKGVATIKMPKLASANIEASVYYSGDKKYNLISKTVNVSVKSSTVIVSRDVDVAYNVAGHLIISLKDDDGNLLAGKTINLLLDGKNYSGITDGQGRVSIEVPTNLAPENYVALISFAGDDSYIASNATVHVNVAKATPVIAASDVSATYNTVKNLTIALKDNHGIFLVGKTVNFVLNGKEYAETTDNQGQVSIAVPIDLLPKSYIAAIFFAGDGEYLPGNATVNVRVIKATPKLIASKATFKSKTKTKKYTITLKNNKNNVMKKAKVTLKVKGKTYKATTNSKGKATFKITKLTNKGTFKAKIKYAGNKYYKSATKTVKLTVKK